MIDIEAVINKYMPIEEGYASKIVEAMNYSLLAGGKRLRPRLMYETYRLFGGNGKEIEPFMAAIEMIHTYSLVHDDLPAMDNDVIRRGKTSTWKAFGEAAGILAGDALLTFAFETAAKAFELTEDSGRIVRAIRVLAQKAGVDGMCGGQAVDVQMTGQEISAEMLEYLYRLKTGALLEASMMVGAIIAGADDQEVAICRKAASDMGYAFQIRDDILDVTGDVKELGKSVGLDERNVKTTYVSLFGLETAQDKVHALSFAAKEKIEKLPGDKTFFNEYINKLEVRRN